MVDNVETALEDAEWHLELARYARRSGAPERIAVGSLVNAFIRGTDALCWHYTGDRCKSGRGHDLHLEFEKLYTRHGLPQRYSKYKDNIRTWVTQEKTKSQYQGKRYRAGDLDKAFKQAERYLDKCVKPVLREEYDL